MDARADPAVCLRPLVEVDLDAADRVMRLAFGTFRGLPDPSTSHGDAQYVRTRFRAAPDCAWVAEANGEVVGSVFVARWGTFGFLGPLSVHPDHWDRRIGSVLMRPVMEALARWEVRQAGLFTFPTSPKHLGLYQKHGFWPRFLTVVAEKTVTRPPSDQELFSGAPANRRAALLTEMRDLTGTVFTGLDLEREIAAVHAQRLGDTVLIREAGELAGIAVCHCGAGSEAGSGACYVKFGAVRPGDGAGARFEALLDACESFAAGGGLDRVVAGVDTGRLDAYRRLLDRGFRTGLTGLTMWLHPDRPALDTPGDYVLDDLR